uniref:Uncharacterized protein n=1 Tax=Tanacetum cinerariifolium TaxID=118510 RepID=A0A699HJ24_TANCI|nr:hypothetical protein [Tanacetum cinerariifolium]
MEKGFLRPKRRGRGKGVKEKQSSVMEDAGIVCDHVGGATSYVNAPSSVVPTTMENVMMLPAVDEHVVASRNNKGPTSYAKLVTNGLWFIRNPFIVKKWNPNVNLQKKDVGSVLVWVKFHCVPMKAFSEDGLSIITAKPGTPLMFDSYTSDMCMQSWGGSSYARAIIDVQADEELKDSIMVAMPKLVGEGFNMCIVRVDYEYKPLKCSSC